MGDELLLVAEDPSLLDELEGLLDVLQQSLPTKAEWTVVYLELADATEAADMLSQFFPSSSVSSPVGAASGSFLGDLGSSLGGVGSGLLDATGLSGLGMTSSTLRIIPDIRTNSLFLTGPQSVIEDALSFLKVLDTSDVPSSLKDMQPRQITVKFADVDAVASLVRDVFKPYLEAPPQQRGQQANPLAAMFGGGGGGGGATGGSASGIRMTLGVDNNNSTITINSNQEIFDEVKSVVLQMDHAAEMARPTVRSVQLRNTDAAVVQSMLRSLMPRVSVSSSSTSGSSGRGGSGAGSSAQSDTARAQQQAQQRLLQQFQGGGGAAGGRGGGAAGGRGGGGAGGARGGAGGARGGAGGGRGGGGRGGR